MKNFIITICLLLMADFAKSQPAKLDSTFGDNGIKISAIGNKSDKINEIALLKDGKILAAGTTNDGKFNKILLVRYNQNGGIDSSFGLDGIQITSIGQNDVALKLIIQSDEKIVVMGYSEYNSYTNSFLLRYNKNGGIDDGFGINGNGLVYIKVGNQTDNTTIFDIAIQSDEKILLTGKYSQNFCLFRYDKDGRVDDKFGTGGSITGTFGGFYNLGIAIAIQTDGKIVLATNVFNGATYQIGIARFNHDGSFDLSFSSDGMEIISIWQLDDEYASDIAIQSDGKIIISGFTLLRGYVNIKFNKDGTLDATYGTKGKAIALFNNFYQAASSMVMQKNDKCIIVGTSLLLNGLSQFAIVRFNVDGSIDDNFRFELDLSSYVDEANAILIQPDGKIIIAGTSNDKLALVRFMGENILSMKDYKIFENNISIYPNPVKLKTTLKYTLRNEEIITIRLLDMQGKVIKTFLQNEIQNPGKYEQTLNLSENLAYGNYLINFSSPNGQMNFKIIK